MRGKRGAKGIRDWMPEAAFLLAVLFILLAYRPLFSPLADGRLQFGFGDFTVQIGEDSGDIRRGIEVYTFNNGIDYVYEKRFFLMQGLSLLSDWLVFSDSQFHSAILLVSLILGCFGIYLLARTFGDGPAQQALLVLTLIPFYFMNEWSIDRIIHIWIWFSYAVFPLFMYLGLRLAGRMEGHILVIYSLLFSFYGFLPHSFVYLLSIHAFSASFAVLRGGRARDVIAFAAVPVLIYALMNLPAIALYKYIPGGYPVSADSTSPDLLSRNGGLANMLSFSNNWWPRVPLAQIFENPAFRYSGFAFFIAIICALAASFRLLGSEGKILIPLSVAAVLVAMFVAMGTKNPAMSWLIDQAIRAGLSGPLGLLREWARICVMIPVFLCLSIAICSAALKRAPRAILLGSLAVIIAVNIAYSPGWTYLNERYAAVLNPDDVYTIAALASDDYKELWVERIIKDQYPPEAFLGISKYGWSFDLPISRLMLAEELPRTLLDELRIRHIIIADDGGPLGKGAYDWLPCQDFGEYRLCENEGAGGPFGVYEGTILVRNETGHLPSLAYLPGHAFAPSINDTEYAGFVMMEADDNAGSSNSSASSNGKRVVLVLEAEDMDGFRGWRHESVRDLNASGGALVVFPRGSSLTANFSPPAGGSYRLAVRGNGSISAKIGNETYDLDRKTPGFSYTPGFRLGAGGQQLEIFAGENTSLDVIWLYDAKENETLDSLFTSASPPATVNGYRKLDPTRWDASVNATRPFLLAFRETYVPGWEARVMRNGEVVQKAAPIRLYGAMSGFWINQTGDIDVRIVHLPQETYEEFLVAPLATLSLCVLYLGHWGYGCLRRGEHLYGRERN